MSIYSDVELYKLAWKVLTKKTPRTRFTCRSHGSGTGDVFGSSVSTPYVAVCLNYHTCISIVNDNGFHINSYRSLSVNKYRASILLSTLIAIVSEKYKCTIEQQD